MAIESWSENTILVDLAPHPDTPDELERVAALLNDTCDRDLVLDFSRVHIINSYSISKLLRLHILLTEAGRRLVLCGVCPAVRAVLEVTDIDDILQFAPTKDAALSVCNPTRSRGQTADE